MTQLLVHLLGDFVLQSDWMAMNKSKRSLPCLVHVLIYTSCFLLLTTSWKVLLVIGATHFILDRWHTPLKKLIHFKNKVFREFYPMYGYCDTTGYYDDSPFNSAQPTKEQIRMYGQPRLFFITAWLYIVTDNFLHLAINYLALKYL